MAKTALSDVNTENQVSGLGFKLPKQAERALDERVVYIMRSILKDVINRGTGRRARALGRNDLHGKQSEFLITDLYV